MPWFLDFFYVDEQCFKCAVNIRFSFAIGFSHTRFLLTHTHVLCGGNVLDCISRKVERQLIAITSVYFILQDIRNPSVQYAETIYIYIFFLYALVQSSLNFVLITDILHLHPWFSLQKLERLKAVSWSLLVSAADDLVDRKLFLSPDFILLLLILAC